MFQLPPDGRACPPSRPSAISLRTWEVRQAVPAGTQRRSRALGAFGFCHSWPPLLSPCGRQVQSGLDVIGGEKGRQTVCHPVLSLSFSTCATVIMALPHGLEGRKSHENARAPTVSPCLFLQQ